MSGQLRVFFTTLPQHLVNGIILGCTYGLLALGYSMVYAVLGMLNFAHGDVFMVSSFAGWAALSTALKTLPGAGPIGLLLAAFVGAIVSGATVGTAVERLAYRPLRKTTRLGLLLGAVGVSMVLQNAMMLVTLGRARMYPTERILGSSLTLGSVTIPPAGAVIVLVSLALTVLLDYLVRHTPWGYMVRATAEDPETASCMGVRADKVVAVTFALGSALAGAAGVMIGLYCRQIDFYMGYLAGMKAFTAAVLGGIGSFRGAIVGGLLLGVAESLGAAMIAPAYKDTVAFAVLILTLLLKPTGILGNDDTLEGARR